MTALLIIPAQFVMNMLQKIHELSSFTKKTAELLLQSGKREADPALADGAALLAQSLGRRRLAALTDILHRYALECQYNVGSGHVLGALAAEWENTL